MSEQPKVEIVPIESLTPDPTNANRGTERGSYMLNDSLVQRGAGRSILTTGDGVILAGNKTHEQAVQAGFTEVIKVHTTGDRLVVVVRDDLKHGDPDATRMALEDNRIGQASLNFDPDVLLAQAKKDENLTEGLWRADELEKILAKAIEESEGLDDELPIKRNPDVPAMDYIFPSDNEWGVPLLLKDKQALSVVAPFNRWGTGARSARMEGTYHFYTDDYRFEGVWRNPEKIIESGCRAVVEPNFSTNDDMPRVVVLWHVFRKRWLARYWQSNGVFVFADLALTPAHRDLALLGVPKGWRSYATYTYGKGYNPEWLEADYNQAVEHAETDEIVFLVYGGSEKYGETCRERGWLWFPAHQQAYFKNVKPDKVRKD